MARLSWNRVVQVMLIALLLANLAVLLARSPQAAYAETTTPSYEYKVVSVENEGYLTTLGQNGWKVVATVTDKGEGKLVLAK